MLKTNTRVMFDPRNQEHKAQYAYFLKNGKWEKPCAFKLEYPFDSIPHMINDKLAREFLQIGARTK